MTDWLPESIQHLAAEEMQKDWNDLMFQSVFYDAYIIGGEYVKAYADLRIATLEKQLAELQDKQRWRDVSQELPDAYHPIIAFISGEETMQPAMMHLDENVAPIWRFLLPIYNDCSSQVTHWIPLPDAPNKRIE